MPSLRDSLEDALAHLPSALGEQFAGHELASVLVRKVPEALEEVVTAPGYKLHGSRGQTSWAQTVWVGVFDRLVTDTAQRGYYLAYLFRADGHGVYLSLMQGTTAVYEELGGGQPYLDVLSDRATVYAGLLGARRLAGLHVGPIELVGNGRRTRGYQAANIVARYYAAGEVPSDAELSDDLDRFLDIYKRLVEANDHLADADTPPEEEADDESGQDDEDTSPTIEARRLRWHLRAERNPRLIARAKGVHGSTCAICGFNYGAFYGSLGEGYIEAHHLVPFADLSGRPTQLDPRRDFAVLCASCHRMVHRRRPPFDLDEIRAALAGWQAE